MRKIKVINYCTSVISATFNRNFEEEVNDFLAEHPDAQVTYSTACSEHQYYLTAFVEYEKTYPEAKNLNHFAKVYDQYN
jgi:hypothetical protein